MNAIDAAVLHVHGSATAVDELAAVRELFKEAFFAPPHNQGSAHLERMTQAWPRRLETPGFRLVMAELAGTPIGCVYGHELTPDTKWWDGAVEPIPEPVTSEFAGRTLAVIDLMVRSEWRRQGLAQRLHAHFLADRSQERATLLMDPINTPALAAYTKWGYQSVGRIQPYPDLPKCEAMVKVLRSTHVSA